LLKGVARAPVERALVDDPYPTDLMHNTPPVTGPGDEPAAGRFDASADVSEADWRKCALCRGGADRRRKGLLAHVIGQFAATPPDDDPRKKLRDQLSRNG
jgi:hypothetical protein